MIRMSNVHQARPPSMRTTSETTSNNEDWKTAVGGSIDGNEIDETPNIGNSSPIREEPWNDRSDGRSDDRALVDQHRGAGTQSPPRSGDLSQIEDNQPSYSANSFSSHRLSSANLRRRAEELSGEEVLQTPQVRRKSNILQGSSASVVSAAASTVYDEIDNLKRRIMRLEATPSSMAGSPFTSGQMLSHKSSGGKHHFQAVKGPPSVTGRSPTYQLSPRSPSESHPLLRESFRRLRNSSVSSQLLKHLDMSISDALVLASRAMDRTSRMRADSLCRSLTEICLYLLENPRGSPLNADCLDPSPDPESHKFPSPRTSNHHLRQYSSLPRNASSRRSLAEFLDHTRGSPEPERSASRLSRLTGNYNQRDDPQNCTESRFQSHTEFLRINSRRARAQSSLSHRDQFQRQEHRPPHDYSPTIVGSEIDSKRRIYSSGIHSRALSHVSATDILDRSPVTRESLYTRYQRVPPEQSFDAVHSPDRRYTPSRQSARPESRIM